MSVKLCTTMSVLAYSQEELSFLLLNFFPSKGINDFVKKKVNIL